MADLSLLDLPRLLGYQFFQYALLGGTVAAVASALIGLFLLLRKEAMTGHSVGHIAFGGLAVGLFFGVSPLLTALAISILSILVISYMRRKGLAKSDAALAVMVAVGFSVGLIIISLAGGFNVELFSFLFGSILTIDLTDLLLVGSLGVVAFAFVGVFFKELMAITFDEEAARLRGIPVVGLETTFNVLAGITIVLAIKVIGVILVGALVVLPGLTALQLNSSFRGTTVVAVIFGIASVLAGILLSAVYDIATSGVIVFTAVGLFALTAAYGRLR